MSSKFEGIVESLKNKNSTGTSEIYTQLISNIKKNRKGDVKLLSDIIACVRRDLVTKDEESADAAFRFLSHICNVAASQMCNGNENTMKPMLIEALVSTATMDCIREYFPIVFSNIPNEEFVTLSYQTICQNKKKLSFVVKDEMLKLVSKISVDRENATPDFSKCYPQMLQIVLVFTVDDEDLLRKHAIRAGADIIQAHPPQTTEIAQIINCLKGLVCPKVSGLLTKNADSLQEVLDNQIPFYLKVIGINVRKSSSLTNTLLKIIEQGFRHPTVNVKSAAFKTWKLLIDELSVDLDLLASQRYLNLVMQPLTTVQTSDSLNVLRITTLWGLAQKLKNKLPALFPTVCLPILHCCLGNLDSSQRSLDVSAASLKASRKSSFYTAMQATGYRATQKKASKSSQLHDIGVQVLMHLLAYSDEEDPIETSSFTITKLDNKFLATPATFNSYGLILIAAVEEVLCNKPDISSELAIVLWNGIHHHLKTLLELNLQKKKREPEMFNALLLAFRNILATSSLSCGVTFAMLRSFLAFPNSILSSTFYGGSSNGVHGFPALTLLRLLFSGRLPLEQSSHGSLELLTCACDLVTSGFGSIIGVLPYCNSVLDVLLAFAEKSLIGKDEELPAVDHCVDIMFKLWVKIGAGLKDHIEKTHEVNQGDSIDHDFTTLYYFLLFPVHLKTFRKDYIDTWDHVYDEFFRGSSFVRTCKPNEICSHISSRILKLVDSNCSNSALVFVGNICNIMARKAQYNHGGFSKAKLSRHDSTVMSPKRQTACQLVLEIHENLADLCMLVKKLFEILDDNPVPHLCETNMKCLAHLFSSIYYSEDIKILFRTFLPSLKSLVSTDHDNMKMFCERLETVFHAVENVYRSCVMESNLAVFQEDFHLLISKCVQSGSSKIRNIAVELWQNIVVNSQQHTLICESMTDDTKSHLFPVYKIMGWSCPWKDVELPATLELPENSEDTQSSDMVAVGYGAFGSPNKTRRFSSPRKSPLRAVSSPMKVAATPPAVKRKLGTITGNVNYVNCVSPFPKPRTPLTERQKEKLREREFIPTMYNELDDKQEIDIEVDTQEDVDRRDNTAPGGDIIESSQSQESPKKKLKIDTGDRVIRNSTVPSTNSGDKVRSSQTLTYCATEKAQQLSDASRVSDSEYTSEEEPPMSSVCETDDNVNDLECDANSTHNSDHSYEYVEMYDASTNETRDHRDITFDDDDKDLGVAPLDESYEDVVMADMSVDAGNVTYPSIPASLHSGDVTVDKVDVANEPLCKSMDDVSVQLECIAEDVHTTNRESNASNVKKKSKKGRNKGKKQANVSVDEVVTTLRENSNVDTHDSNISTSSQSDVKGQQNNVKRTRKKKSGKALKAQAECNDTAVKEEACSKTDTQQPVLRRSQRSKKTSSKEDKDNKDAVDATTALLDKEPASHVGLKTQDVCRDDVNNERAASEIEIEPSPSVRSEDLRTESNNIEKYIDIDATDVDMVSDDGDQDKDTTLYEYVEVTDTSCCDVARRSSTFAHNDDPTPEISLNENPDPDCVVEADISMATSETEVTGNVVPASDEPVRSANLTFNIEPKVTGNVVPASDEPMCSANSTFVVAPNCDEDDFVDARSSLGMSSTAVNRSDTCIEDDPNFKEIDISAIAVHVSEDNKTADDMSERDACGKKTSDKETKDASVPFKTANSNLEGGVKVNEISSSKAAHIELLTDDYQTSPVSSKQKDCVPIEIGDLNVSTVSPNARGILKRRSVVTDSSPAASPSTKRVSFAEPVSIAGTSENYDVLQSPRSFHYRTKNVPKVNRRLSLQSERMRYPNENKVAVSPLSLRSVRVAEAIANIKAKDSNSSRLLANRASTDDAIDFSKLSIRDLQDPEFLRSLDRSQGQQLFRILNSIELDLVTNVLGT